ncbi:MAG: hypothetical protein ABI599_03070 [Flavobacteriales bacterium]
MEQDEGIAVEQENVALREEMLRFNVITDTDDKIPVLSLLVQRKMVVPVHGGMEDPDEWPLFATLYKHEKGKELHVFTSVLHIPESCDAPGVVFYPLVDLLDDAMKHGIRMLLIDPKTPHGVGFVIDEEGPQLFRLGYIEDNMDDLLRET